MVTSSAIGAETIQARRVASFLWLNLRPRQDQRPAVAEVVGHPRASGRVDAVPEDGAALVQVVGLEARAHDAAARVLRLAAVARPVFLHDRRRCLEEERLPLHFVLRGELWAGFSFSSYQCRYSIGVQGRVVLGRQ